MNIHSDPGQIFQPGDGQTMWKKNGLWGFFYIAVHACNLNLGRHANWLYPYKFFNHER